MLRKITIIQCPVSERLSMEDNLFIFKQKPDFVILPEYYNVDPSFRNTPLNASQAGEYLKYCRDLSDRLDTTLIAGTTVEHHLENFYNTSFIYSKGDLIGHYRKSHPTENEQRYQITPGREFSCFQIDDLHISILICADVLHPESFDGLAKLRPDIIFVPTTSPFKPHETIRDKFMRDQTIFVDGARSAGGYIIKCCAVGSLWGGRLQGRSLAAAPWGIMSRIAPDEENRKRILSIILDITELREFRRKHLQMTKNR